GGPRGGVGGPKNSQFRGRPPPQAGAPAAAAREARPGPASVRRAESRTGELAGDDRLRPGRDADRSDPADKLAAEPRARPSRPGPPAPHADVYPGPRPRATARRRTDVP